MPLPEADLRIDAGWIVPVQPAGKVMTNQSLMVREGVIAAILPSEEADTGWIARRHVRLPDHVLIPGLVNLHTHAAMNLLRGYADDLPLMTWLHDHIWPAEGRHVSPGFVRDGTRLACLEMLKSGITCFNDMYFFSEAAVEAAVETGIRIAAGLIVVEAREAALIREAPAHPLPPARRRALMQRFAVLAAMRLAVAEDPAALAELRGALRVE